MTEREFGSSFLSLADALYKVAFYILETQDEAEDAVQELYLKLWKNRDALDGIRNPKAYCITLLRNRCLDRLRQRRLVARPETLPEPECPGSQDEQIDVRERLDKVLAAIKSLPDRQREVLTLRTLDGLSYEEIARRTGTNYLTLRVLLSQARSKLKKLI